MPLRINRPARIGWVLPVVVGCLVVAGCQDKPPAPSAGVGYTPSQPATYNPTPGPAMFKSVVVRGLGRVLTDSRGITLYTNNGPRDSPRPHCVGVCTNVWHPVLINAPAVAPEVSGLPAKFSVLRRPGGQYQLAVNGHRVHTFVGDTKPGEAKGFGFVTGTGTGRQGDLFTWKVIRVPDNAPTSIPLRVATPTPMSTGTGTPR